MTYTFKLSRRLAVSRSLVVLCFLPLLAGCASDSTGPEPSGAPISSRLPSFRIVPGVVTVETNQRIRFRGEDHTGKRWLSPLRWEALGGTVDENGTFVAAEPGTYSVVGRGRNKSDTSVVVVVPRQPNLAAIELSPATAEVAASATHAFAAVGRLQDGSTVEVGVRWATTGGSIDPDGLYRAGAEPGSYLVIAASTNGKLADTAAVTVTEPAPDPAPEPAPEPEPEPEPELAEVVLKPVSVTLETGRDKRFAAFGRNTTGDSVAVAVTYTATGGTITAEGLYTAGSQAGSYRVIADAEGLADTAAITITPPTAPTARPGVPYGPFSTISAVAPFSMGAGPVSASNIISRIDAARSNGYRLMLAMTGGSHDLYMSVIDGVYQFDEAKWRAKMDTYNTAAIRDAVARGIADGVIVGNYVMDEPHVSRTNADEDGGNTWGPPGTMTKARVDGLCGYVKQIFPTLSAGVIHRHDIFQPDRDYAVCDFIISQYATRLGSVTSFRDAGLAFARRSGIRIAFSLNILDGGTQDRDGTWDCKDQGGYRGTYAPNCQVTPTQLRSYGLTLGPSGCAFLHWRWDDAFMTRSGNQDSFRAVADSVKRVSAASCARPSAYLASAGG